MDYSYNSIIFSTNDNKVFRCQINGNKVISYNLILSLGNNNGTIEDVLCHSDGSLWVLISKYLKSSKYGKTIPLDMIAYKYLVQITDDKQNITATLSDSLIFNDSRLLALSAYDFYRERNFNKVFIRPGCTHI